jgi:hypothetical protein
MYTPAVTMVAAWMSAETGVGPAIASGSQTRGIAPTSRRADEEEERDQRGHRPAPAALVRDEMRMLRQLPEDDRPVPLRIQRPEEEEDAEHEAEVADPVHDECLVAGGRVGELPVPEADQRPRAEADALPADEHEEQAVAQHERQHREREQVQIGEEAPVARVVVHVPGRVDVDEPADAGDDQDHHRRELVHLEGDVGVEGPRVDPGEEPRQQEPVVLGQVHELEEGRDREHEGRPHRRTREPPDEPLPEPLLERRAGERERRRPREREERDERHVAGRRHVRPGHCRSRSVASTSIVSNSW